MRDDNKFIKVKRVEHYSFASINKDSNLFFYSNCFTNDEIEDNPFLKIVINMAEKNNAILNSDKESVSIDTFKLKANAKVKLIGHKYLRSYLQMVNTPNRKLIIWKVDEEFMKLANEYYYLKRCGICNKEFKIGDVVIYNQNPSKGTIYRNAYCIKHAVFEGSIDDIFSLSKGLTREEFDNLHLIVKSEGIKVINEKDIQNIEPEIFIDYMNEIMDYVLKEKLKFKKYKSEFITMNDNENLIYGYLIILRDKDKCEYIGHNSELEQDVIDVYSEVFFNNNYNLLLEKMGINELNIAVYCRRKNVKDEEFLQDRVKLIDLENPDLLDENNIEKNSEEKNFLGIEENKIKEETKLVNENENKNIGEIKNYGGDINIKEEDREPIVKIKGYNRYVPFEKNKNYGFEIVKLSIPQKCAGCGREINAGEYALKYYKLNKSKSGKYYMDTKYYCNKCYEIIGRREDVIRISNSKVKPILITLNDNNYRKLRQNFYDLIKDIMKNILYDLGIEYSGIDYNIRKAYSKTYNREVYQLVYYLNLILTNAQLEELHKNKEKFVDDLIRKIYPKYKEIIDKYNYRKLFDEEDIKMLDFQFRFYKRKVEAGVENDKIDLSFKPDNLPILNQDLVKIINKGGKRKINSYLKNLMKKTLDELGYNRYTIKLRNEGWRMYHFYMSVPIVCDKGEDVYAKTEKEIKDKYNEMMDKYNVSLLIGKNPIIQYWVSCLR